MTAEAATEHGTSERTAPTVFLHIGTMKTGTSFLQRVLQRNAALLEEDGVRYPMENSRWAMQVRAARDILDIKGKPTQGGWVAMVDQIRAWPGRAAVVSMEFYSLASAARAQRIVAALAPARVEIIITARDLVRIMPSAWQSMIKQGHPWSFAEFTASVTGNGDVAPDAHRRFWRHHDLVAITSKWIDAAGADNVHVVTVPPPGAAPSVLWERFCAVIGTAPDRYDISQDRKSNFSLSYSDSELMRQINAALRDEMDKGAYKRWATRYFANRVLRASAGERTAHDRPGLPPEAHAWAVQRSHEMVDALTGLGVHVVGDLADLVPEPVDPAGDDVAAAPVTTYPDGAAHIIAALLKRIAEVDPQLPSKMLAGVRLQDPDEAAESDDADLDDDELDDDGLDDDGLDDDTGVDTDELDADMVLRTEVRT